mmetsp:Transcript_53912/g.143506  ORF Transcript_53912/g.143506 Transcript_53912/m.143506 type:complete len:229 (+) Transcript_53912:1267-1953(+)
MGLLREHHHADRRGDEDQQRDGPGEGHAEVPAPHAHAQGEEAEKHGYEGVFQDLVRAAPAVAFDEPDPFSVRLDPEHQPRPRRALLQLVPGHPPPHEPVGDQLRPPRHRRPVLEGQRGLQEEHVGELGDHTVTLLPRRHGDPHKCGHLAEAPPADHVDQGKARARQSQQDHDRILRQATHQPQHSDAHGSDDRPLVQIAPQHGAEVVDGDRPGGIHILQPELRRGHPA